MRRITSHLIVALITFTIGVAVPGIRVINNSSSVPAAKPAEGLPQSNQITPVSLEEILRNRDLSIYDQGGEYGCAYLPYNSTVAACNESTARARDFIWKHWREKRRGYVRVRLLSEDTFDVAHFFVEPDDKGAWRVECRLVRDYENAGDWVFASVSRRRARKYDIPPLGTLMLVFRDKDGKVIFEV
jgi:hypothetical protein